MEKASGHIFVNVYSDIKDGFIWHGSLCRDRLRADKQAETYADTDKRLACLDITWVEGQGLEAAR